MCLQLQNLGCYSVSHLELRLRLPSVAAEDRRFMTLTDVFSYNVSDATTRACVAYLRSLSSFLLTAPQATGVNCSVQSELAQLKARQTDVRSLHPEDMMQNDVLVSPPPPLPRQPLTTSAHLKMWPVCSELQPVVVHGGRVRGAAASERTGCRHPRQQKSS